MQTGELYAVLDACDAPSVPLLCEGLGPERAVSLYRGEAVEEYADIAPYLVRVDSEELLTWILAFGKQVQGWGILIAAPIPFEALRTHLRRFLRILDPEGEPLYFRFYDPRVLQMFLPTCSGDQIDQFYGRIGAFFVLDGEELNRIRKGPAPSNASAARA